MQPGPKAARPAIPLGLFSDPSGQKRAFNLEQNIIQHIQNTLERIHTDAPSSFASHIPIQALSYDPNTSTFLYRVTVIPALANLWGIAHGGMLATIFDTCMGCSVRALCGGAISRTVSLSVNYLRPVPLERMLYVQVQVVKKGAKLVFTDLKASLDPKDASFTNTAASVFALL